LELGSVVLGGGRGDGVHEEIAGVCPVDLGNLERRLWVA
jgi:hypothetical protein